MPTLFSRIVQGEIPSHRIAENEEFYAFLDISPVQMGHTLVIPKREEDYFFDLTTEELGRMMGFAKVVAKALGQATACQRVGLSVVGLEVPHAHLHLIPINEASDMRLEAKLSATQEQLAEMAERIRAFIPQELR